MNAVVQKLFTEVPRSIPYRVLEAVLSPESGVRIWIAHLDSILPNDGRELIASLDSGERARVAQFRFERDRQHFLATRGILRHLLGAALDIPASALVFEYGPHGKPAIAGMHGDERTLRFNISHAAGSAIFALAWDRNLGIDLEASGHLVSDPQDLFDLAMCVLSTRELTIWRALPDAARRPAFLRAWTRKEAYVKATGEGLFDRLQTIEVALDAAAPQPSLTIRSPSEKEKVGRDWTVHDLPTPDGFVAAVAVEQVNP